MNQKSWKNYINLAGPSMLADTAFNHFRFDKKTLQFLEEVGPSGAVLKCNGSRRVDDIALVIISELKFVVLALELVGSSDPIHMAIKKALHIQTPGKEMQYFKERFPGDYAVNNHHSYALEKALISMVKKCITSSDWWQKNRSAVSVACFDFDKVKKVMEA